MNIPLLTVTTAMWCWNPNSADVCVVPWPDPQARSARYDYTSGACYAIVHTFTPAQRERYVLAEALRLITHYRCDVDAVHRAFLAIKEYHHAMEHDPGVPKEAA
jgi:hypothetical protein